MTWAGNLVVTRIIPTGEGNIHLITARAKRGDVRVAKEATSFDQDAGEFVYEDVEVPRLFSNTEGPVVSVSVSIQVDSKPTQLKVGDDFHVNGHFTA